MSNASGEALCSISKRTVSARPLAAAEDSGVRWLMLGTLQSAPAASEISATDTCPEAAERFSAVYPKSSFIDGSASFSKRYRTMSSWPYSQDSISGISPKEFVMPTSRS